MRILLSVFLIASLHSLASAQQPLGPASSGPTDNEGVSTDATWETPPSVDTSSVDTSSTDVSSPNTDASTARGPRGWATFETAVFVREDRGPRITTASPLWSVNYLFADLVRTHVRFGLAGLRVNGDFTEAFKKWRWSNLEFGGAYRHEFGPYPWLLELSAGITLAAPTASLDEDSFESLTNSAVALAAASTMRGSRDPWLWAPETFSIVVPLELKLVHPDVHARAGLDFGTLISTGEGDTELAVQFLLEGGVRIARKLLLALAFSGISVPTEDGDNFQAALALRSRAELGSMLFMFDVWANLDNPGGFAFDDGIWGIVLSVGAGLP